MTDKAISSLFMDDTGLSLNFNISQCKDKSSLKKLILLHGGQVSRQKPVYLTLVNPNESITEKEKGSVYSNYIDACVRKRKLLKTTKYIAKTSPKNIVSPKKEPEVSSSNAQSEPNQTNSPRKSKRLASATPADQLPKPKKLKIKSDKQRTKKVAVKPATKPDSHIDKSAAVNAKKKNVEDPGIQKSPKLSTPKQTQMNIVKSAKSKSSKVSEKIPSNEMDDDLDLPETPIANNHEDQEFFKELRDHQLVALKKQSTPIKRSENSTSKQHSTSKGKVTINNSPKRVQDYDPKEIFQEYDPSVLVHLTPEEQRQKGQYYKEMTNLRLNYPNFSQDEVCIALYRATGYFNIAKKLLDCNLIFELLDDNTKQYVFEPIHDKLLQSGSFGLLLQSKEAIAKRMEFFDLTFTSI